jgi:MFS family permease
MHSDAQPIPALPHETDETRAEVRRMAVLFGIVYFAQGIYQVSALLNQPVKFYLRKQAGYSSDQIAGFLAFAIIPWMIKPLYGLLSDYVPIAGYRRKSYLILANLLAAGAFCLAMGIREPRILMWALALTGLGVATSDVVVDALMVESGQRTGKVKMFQGVQWACISLSGIGSALAGGYLCEHFAPGPALRIAAAVSAGIGGVVAAIAWLVVREERARLNVEQLRATTRGVISAFRSVRLGLILLYLLLAHFNPGMETPLYVHQTETLGFSQAFVGNLEAVINVGYFVGAALFAAVIARRLSTRNGIAICLLVFAAGTLAYLLMRNRPTAVLANFLYGVGYMMSNLALLSLAAENCPKRAEGFTFAAMMSVLNFAMKGADYTGSVLYERVTHKVYWPLPVISAGITLLAVALVPLLPKNAVKDEETPRGGFEVAGV